MQGMLKVRSARALSPSDLSRALPVHADCAAATPRPHASRAAPLPASHARFSTGQDASAFNQPLSFDTSKVTKMGYMFDVRSARALAPTALHESGPHRARRMHPTPSRLPACSPCAPRVPWPPQPLSPALPCTCRLHRRHPTPSRPPGRTSSRNTCPPFDSAGRVGVRPRAQLRHVQRHAHAPDVRGALRARALGPTLSVSPPVDAKHVAATQRPHASRPAPLPASHARLSTRQAASAFNQPLSFDTSKVTTMERMFAVRSARALPPQP